MARFVVISDTHFRVPGSVTEDKTFWNRVLRTRIGEVGECLIETINVIAPDFVVHCGDITGLCEMRNWDFACSLLDRLDCPWFAVLGNHDTWFPGLREAFSARFARASDRCYYRRDLLGMRFLFLDTVHWYTREGSISPYLDKELYDHGEIAGMGPSDEQLAWLSDQLARSQGWPVALVNHSPLGYRSVYPVSTMPKGQPSDTGRTSLENYFGPVMRRSEMRETIRCYGNVRVVFAGHWHIFDKVTQDGVVHCQTGSLREYPFEIRVVEVGRNRLEVETVPLLSGGFQAASLIPEWHNEWIAGSASDRTFSVPLS